jgi:hypothetical protein
MLYRDAIPARSLCSLAARQPHGTRTMRNPLHCLALAVLSLGTAHAQIAFEEVTTPAGIDLTGRSMGLAWGDYNGDGWPDLYTSHHAAIDVLYRNNRNGTFTNVFPGSISNPTTPDTHGAAFGDFDNDGDQDIMQLSGAQKGSGSSPNEFYVMRNGIATDEATARGVLDAAGRGRTPLWLDWNNDGLLDLFFANLKRPDGTNSSAYFEQHAGIFYRTTLPGLSPNGNNLFAQSSELLGDGRRMLIVQDDSYPMRIVAFGTDGSIDLRSQLHIPQTQNVRDVAIEDFNGDLLPDFYMVRLVPNTPEVTLADSRTLKAHFNLSGTERGMSFRCDCTLTVTTGPGFELKATDVYIGANGHHPKAIPFSATEEDLTAEGIAPHTPGKSFGLYIGHNDATEVWTLLASKPSRMALNVLITSNADITQLNPINVNSGALAQPGRLLLRTATGYVDAPGSAASEKRACESVVAGDFDNDMDVDLYLVCRSQTGNLPNVLLQNNGHGVFTVVPQAGGAEGSMLGRGDAAAVADYDNDGFLDIAISNGNGEPPFENGPYQLFHNKGNGNHWLELQLHGVASNRDGVGARVILTAGGVSQMREQGNGVHRLAQNSQRVHFGLAQNSSASSVVIYWPSGTVQTLNNVAANQILEVTESSTGGGPSFALDPSGLAFGDQLHATSSAPRAVTLTNTGTSPLPLVSRTLGGTNPGQFAQVTSCPATVAAGASCTISVTFKPTTRGNMSATLTVKMGNGGGSHSVTLTGRGT